MAINFLQELYQKGYLDPNSSTSAESFSHALKRYSQEHGWILHTTSSPADIKEYRSLYGPHETKLSSLVFSTLKENKVHVVAPEDIIKGNLYRHLFKDPGARVSSQSSRLRNLTAVAQLHEGAEAFEIARTGNIGVQFGGHKAESVIQTEMQGAALLGSQTLSDLFAFRRAELRGIESNPAKISEPYYQAYRNRMQQIIESYTPTLNKLRQEEYIGKMHTVSGGSQFFFPESRYLSPEDIGSVIGENDSDWLKFLEKQAVKNEAKVPIARARGSLTNILKSPISKLILGGLGALWLFSGGSPSNPVPPAQDIGLTVQQRRILMNEGFNSFDGLPHGGLAEEKRHQLTPFGSKYDTARVLAEMLGKTFESFTRTKGFKEALSNAQEVKKLGAGLFGEAHLMETELAGQKFQFVRKTILPGAEENILATAKNPEKYLRALDLKKEAKMMRPLGMTEAVPSVYQASKSELYMEYMPGTNLAELYKSGQELSTEAKKHLFSTIEEAGLRGIKNLDIHHGNILFDPTSGRVSWIDWGLATKVKKKNIRAASIMEEKLRKYISPLSLVKIQSDIRSLGIQKITSNSIPTKISEIVTPIEGMQHGGMAQRKRSSITEFGSPWKGMFGGLSKKISKFLGTGVKDEAIKLLHPEKAAKAAFGSTVEDFAKSIHVRGFVAKDEAGEAFFSKIVQQQPGLEAGAGVIEWQGKPTIVLSPTRLRETFVREASKRGMAGAAAREAVESDDFIKTVLYHEALEQQMGQRFQNIVRMPAQHMGSQVLVGEGGFLQKVGNEKLKELFTVIRSSRSEETAALHAGFEAFNEEGVAPVLRKLTTDFGSGYRGLLNSNSLTLSRSVVSNNKRASASLTKSSRDLRMAQEQLWDFANNGGQKHSSYAGQHVKQLSRFGGGL